MTNVFSPERLAWFVTFLAIGVGLLITGGTRSFLGGVVGESRWLGLGLIGLGVIAGSVLVARR